MLAKKNKIRKEKLIIIRRIRLLDLGLAYTITLFFVHLVPISMVGYALYRII